MKKTSFHRWKRAILCLSAASNDSSPGNGISGTVGGSSWQSSATTGYYSPGSSGSGYFDLQGWKISNGDSTAFEFVFADTAVVGKQYDFSSVGEILYYDSKTDEIQGTYNNGSFKLTSRDETNKKVTGTFSAPFYRWGNDQDSIVITNGKFNCTYITAP